MSPWKLARPAYSNSNKSMRSKQRRLPDGSETDDYKLYLTEWGKRITALERLFGWNVTGYDPGFGVQVPGCQGALGHFSVPVSAANRAQQLLDTMEAAEQALSANQVFHTPLAKGLRPDRTWNEYEADAVRRTQEALAMLGK